MRKNLELCKQACELECDRLNDLKICPDYYVEPMETGGFCVRSKNYKTFHCWWRFVELIKLFYVNAYFGIYDDDSNGPSVGLFIF